MPEPCPLPQPGCPCPCPSQRSSPGWSWAGSLMPPGRTPSPTPRRPGPGDAAPGARACCRDSVGMVGGQGTRQGNPHAWARQARGCCAWEHASAQFDHFRPTHVMPHPASMAHPRAAHPLCHAPSHSTPPRFSPDLGVDGDGVGQVGDEQRRELPVAEVGGAVLPQGVLQSSHGGAAGAGPVLGLRGARRLGRAWVDGERA